MAPSLLVPAVSCPVLLAHGVPGACVLGVTAMAVLAGLLPQAMPLTRPLRVRAARFQIQAGWQLDLVSGLTVPGSLVAAWCPGHGLALLEWRVAEGHRALGMVIARDLDAAGWRRLRTALRWHDHHGDRGKDVRGWVGPGPDRPVGPG